MKKILTIILAFSLSACSSINEIATSNALKSNSSKFLPNKSNPKIYTLPVGQGNCQLLTCPKSQKAMVFDCGSTGINRELKNRYNLIKWDKNETVRTINNIFNDQGIKSYNIVLSHPDADHYNFITEMILQVSNKSNVLPENVFLGGTQEQYTAESMSSFLTFLGAKQNVKVQVFPNNTISLPNQQYEAISCIDDEVKSYILAANAGNNPNDKSVVIAVNIPYRKGFIENPRERYAIFSGDMTAETYNFIANNPVIKYTSSVSVITAPHHGAFEESSTKQISDSTKPKFLLVSAGPRPDYGHPSCDTLSFYNEHLEHVTSHRIGCFKKVDEQKPKEFMQYEGFTRAIYTTFDSGAIVLEFEDDSISVLGHRIPSTLINASLE